MKDCHHMHLTSKEFKCIQLLIIMHSNYFEGLVALNILNIKEISPENWAFAVYILFKKLAQRPYILIHKNFTLQELYRRGHLGLQGRNIKNWIIHINLETKLSKKVSFNHLSFHEKMHRFFIIHHWFQLFVCKSLLFKLTYVFEIHHSSIIFFNNSCNPSILFVLTYKNQSANPLSSITLHLEITTKTFLWWTLRAFATFHIKDELWTLTIAIKITCFVANWTL